MMLIVAKLCDSMLDSQILTYPVHEVTPYISWSYFFHAWGVRSSESQSPEVMGLMADARQMLMEMEDVVHPQCLYRLCTAGADGDDLVVEGTRIPLLRQQEPHTDGSPLLCLSDFVRPIALSMPDRIGLFAATVHTDRAFPDDPYRNLLLQTLMDRLAEAAVELMHAYVRRVAWGYAPDESITINDMLQGRYQGIRPAVGYPSLPDQSINFILDSLLDMQRIGIRLTENGAMHPHSSVSGLMLAHPAARYFTVGHIGEDQFKDYAHRRGLPLDKMQKFLAALL